MQTLLSPMHIAFGISNSYTPYIAVTIKSVIENNRNNELYFHVLTDYISNSNRERLYREVERNRNVHINIHLVEDGFLQDLKTGVWKIHAWYRILLPAILPASVDKVLYLDADTLVVADLSQLFTIDMTNRSVAAAIDVQSLDYYPFDRCGYERKKKYICSGVLFMNLDYWRSHNLTGKLVDWAKRNRNSIQFPDQDAINYVCQDSKIVLPLRYGILNTFFNNKIFYTEQYINQLRDCIENPVIIHYAGCYPWIKSFAKHPMNSEWLKYNNMLSECIRVESIPRKWLYIKNMIWWILHPSRKGNTPTLDEIRARISENNDLRITSELNR